MPRCYESNGAATVTERIPQPGQSLFVPGKIAIHPGIRSVTVAAPLDS